MKWQIKATDCLLPGGACATIAKDLGRHLRFGSFRSNVERFNNRCWLSPVVVKVQWNYSSRAKRKSPQYRISYSLQLWILGQDLYNLRRIDCQGRSLRNDTKVCKINNLLLISIVVPWSAESIQRTYSFQNRVCKKRNYSNIFNLNIFIQTVLIRSLL